MKNILLFLFLILSASTFASTTQDSITYEKDLKYLFQINGEQASYQKSIKVMIVELKKHESNVPETYWAKAEVEFVDDLMNMLIPIYRQNLSHDDIKAMIDFYQTVAGKRIAEKLPKIATESMQAGMSWGQSIGEKIRADIERKGFKIRLPFTP
ncbi:DUF2059 domain-containing protein [Labilibaculum antarcticum]|uniref:DUF2059 domain-containing protein n=1 Tax=Labilibaculum antarcticum TaxID=1717717 RepID=A0A1Y1CMC1_9BACT|nr:DUF2059 domain-containing protein [Labilibaculum antarcticum]BAX80411.1 hypothetical protein ALGA_2068 [Labilibaculum antarcticum]